MADMRLTPEQVLQYLDNNIVYWRKALRDAKGGTAIVSASDYIDAYQSTRVTLFGELKPLEDWQR